MYIRLPTTRYKCVKCNVKTESVYLVKTCAFCKAVFPKKQIAMFYKNRQRFIENMKKQKGSS